MSEIQPVPAQRDRPQILSISFSPLARDARVLRQISVLAEYGDVTTVGFGEMPSGASHHVEVPHRLASLPQTPLGVLKLAFHAHGAAEFAAPALAAARDLLEGRRFDLVVANDARALPLAFSVAQGAPVWADMHEWAPEEQSNLLSWRLLVAPFMTYLCRTYLPRCAAVTTVSSLIAEMYRDVFGVHAVVVRNARSFADLRPSAPMPGCVRLVHSGIGVRGRGIELLIDAVLESESRITLDLFLVFGDGDHYRAQLVDRAKGSTRIRFHEPVAPDELPVVLNEFDIGVFMLRPITANYRFMLPNKFFDFVQARLGVLFSQSAETNKLIDEHRLGRVVPGFGVADLVSSLASLSDSDIQGFKRNADAAARELSYETDAATQRRLLRSVLGKN